MGTPTTPTESPSASPLSLTKIPGELADPKGPPQPAERSAADASAKSTPNTVISPDTSKENTPPTSKDDKKTASEPDTSIPKNIFTRDRAYALLIPPGVKSIDLSVRCHTITRSLKDALCHIVGDNTANVEKLKQYSKMRGLLEGPLSVLTGDIDFTDKLSVDKAVNSNLKEMLEIKDSGSKPLEEVIKEKLKEQSMTEADIDAVKEYIKMRIVLGLRQKIELDNLAEKNDAIQIHINNLIKQEELAANIAKRGRSDDIPNTIANIKNFNPEQLNAIKSEKTAKKIANGAYATYNKEGKPSVVITEFSTEAIKATIETLRNGEKIVWNNVPQNFKHEAEIETLRNGKKCFFRDDTGAPKETILSQNMPKPPGGANNLAEWFRQIRDCTSAAENTNPTVWANIIKNNLTTLVQEVVGKEPERLMAFWDDMLAHKHEEKMTQPTEAIKYFLSEQVTKLEEAYQYKIKELKEKIEKITKAPTPSKELLIEKAHFETQLAKINEALAQFNLASIIRLAEQPAKGSLLKTKKTAENEHQKTVEDTVTKYINHLFESGTPLEEAKKKIDSLPQQIIGIPNIQDQVAEQFYIHKIVQLQATTGIKVPEKRDAPLVIGEARMTEEAKKKSEAEKQLQGAMLDYAKFLSKPPYTDDVTREKHLEKSGLGEEAKNAIREEITGLTPTNEEEPAETEIKPRLS